MESRRSRLSPDKGTLLFALQGLITIVGLFLLATDPLAATALRGTSDLCTALLLLLFGISCVHYFKSESPHYWLYVLFVCGVILRLLYVNATPFMIRGHDVGAHIDYINYMSNFLRIPPAKDGWEFYQPPAYYFLMALWLRVGAWWGRSLGPLIHDLQTWSLLASSVTLAIGCFLATKLFEARQFRERLLFVSVLATLPGLIFFAARINNDILVQLLSFSAFALLWRWWQKGKDAHWHWFWVLTSLAILTKYTAVLLIPMGLLCLAVKRQSWGRKALLALGASLVVIVLTGWLFAVRFALVSDTSSSLIGDSAATHGALLMDNDIGDFLTFNPWKMAQRPFINPWSDLSRRQYFFEYLFRSAFFGEFDFGIVYLLLSSIIILIASICVGLALWGLLQELRRSISRTLPLWGAALVLIGAQIALRLSASFSPLQDFRYSSLLVIPFAYYLAISTQYLPKTARGIAASFIGGLSALCAIFIIALGLGIT